MEQITLNYIAHNINIVFIVLSFCASGARMCCCDLICWDMSFLMQHTLLKAWALFTWLRDKKLNSSAQLLLNLHTFFFSSPEHHLTQLLLLDSTSRICYLRRNLQRNCVVGCQVEVTNGLKLVYRVDCVRWYVSYKLWQQYNLGITYWCDYSYN